MALNPINKDKSLIEPQLSSVRMTLEKLEIDLEIKQLDLKQAKERANLGLSLDRKDHSYKGLYVSENNKALDLERTEIPSIERNIKECEERIEELNSIK